jgi:hypothetical protein
VIIAAYERLPGVETRDDGAPFVQVVTDLLRRLLLTCARLLLCVAQRQSVTLGQIKRVEDALIDIEREGPKP